MSKKKKKSKKRKKKKAQVEAVSILDILSEKRWTEIPTTKPHKKKNKYNRRDKSWKKDIH
jgi:hypothetical protein